MGLMDFIKGELIEVIEWTDDSRDTLSFRFPDDDKEIKNGAQLIVRESQVAQFVYLGEFGDTFGPGKHTLTTDNIPVLTKLKSWPYGFNPNRSSSASTVAAGPPCRRTSIRQNARRYCAGACAASCLRSYE